MCCKTTPTSRKTTPVSRTFSSSPQISLGVSDVESPWYTRFLYKLHIRLPTKFGGCPTSKRHSQFSFSFKIVLFQLEEVTGDSEVVILCANLHPERRYQSFLLVLEEGESLYFFFFQSHQFKDYQIEEMCHTTVKFPECKREDLKKRVFPYTTTVRFVWML